MTAPYSMIPQCKKMDLKIIQSLLEGVKYAEDAEKPKNELNPEDFSEELEAV